MVPPFCVNFVALLSRFSRIWFRRKKVLAGGGNLVQVFLHLVRLIDVGGSQSGKADDRIHWSADVVGHVVEEGCFGTVGVFRRVQCEVTPVSGALRDNGADPDHRGDQNAENSHFVIK